MKFRYLWNSIKKEKERIKKYGLANVLNKSSISVCKQDFKNIFVRTPIFRHIFI